MPRLTCGVPVFNGERFLAETLQSILAQTYDDFELLVADNASTDRTVEICRDFMARDKRVRLFSAASNRGAAWNFNRLVREAVGEYFKWHPYDDLLVPDFVAQCIARLDSHPDEILCYPRTQVIGERGEPLLKEPEDVLSVTSATPDGRLSEYFRSSFLNRGCNAALGVTRTGVLRKTRLIGAYAGSDKVLLAELALLGPFHQLPGTLFFRREHSGSSLAVHPDPLLRDLWFDTDRTGKRQFIHWKWFIEYVRAIHHIPMSVTERFRAERVMREYWKLYEPRLKREIMRSVGR